MGDNANWKGRTGPAGRYALTTLVAFNAGYRRSTGMGIGLRLLAYGRGDSATHRTWFVIGSMLE
jgi:hypothetical protein